MKNTITQNGFLIMPCPFCQADTKHQINFKCYGFNTAVHKQDVHFYKTCTSCDGWVVSQITVILREDWDKLKMVA